MTFLDSAFIEIAQVILTASSINHQPSRTYFLQTAAMTNTDTGMKTHKDVQIKFQQTCLAFTQGFRSRKL